MVEPKFGLRAFQVSLSTPTLSVHSTVGSGASSCYRRTSTMGATIPLFISTVKQRMGRVINSNNCIVPHKFLHDPDPLNMMARRGVASTSGSDRPQKSGRQTTRVGRHRSERLISKKRWGHLVEWVDKASFTRLNKLFKINAFERAYKVLISNKNLLALIGNPKSFISPIFHCLALPSLVLDEHFVLKDLPFYKIARLADSEAHQAHLEEREKKRQEWTLRQVSIAGRPSSNSLSGLPLKRGRNLLLVLPPVPVHLTTAAGITPESDEKIPSTNDITHHEPRRPFVSPNHFSDESFEYLALSLPCPKSNYVPSGEEVFELLRRIPSFIEKKTLVQNTRMLFLTTQWILVEIDNDPNRLFMTRLSYDTSDSIISCSMPMQDYTDFETTEVRVQLFYRLETVKTMRAYIAYNMDGNEDLLASLETTNWSVEEGKGRE
ncbi:hypothetical protein CK203_085306 [Vitis vinifera]|uniref:Uncharacterized protein n=1 Tax=Vitis vinifera TaxID=29760 RepID=A0A438DD56_VITVI|nr:hypothetical protein CK203_085306 [Vitis vinifera]